MAEEAKNGSSPNGEDEVHVSDRSILEAARNGEKEEVSLLLARGAKIEAADNDGRTPLLLAARYGHKEVASLLLERGANIEAAHKGAWTSLLLAAANGHKEVASLLLERGANIEAADKDGWTPLLYALKNGHKEVAYLLVERGANIEAADKDGWRPLLHAARHGHKEVVSLLLERGANTEAADKDGRTPLLYALENGHKELAYLLVERGANIEAADKDGGTPPLYALKNGHKEVAYLLVERGANIEATDKDGRTPLLLAARYGDKEMASLLLERGANTEAADKDERTPLLYAAANGYKELAALLLERGANMEAADTDGRTPLLLAARYGHKEVASLLLERGANIEAADKDGWTPLLYALKNGHKEVAYLLVERGANIEAADKDGWRPLLHAARHGHKEVVSLLLERGANIEAADKDGGTPLLYALKNGHKEVAYLLVERGANIEATDKDGRTPLLLAARYGDKEMASLLLERGANIEAAEKDGKTPLLYAAGNGLKELASPLSERGANIEAADEDGRTPLLYAARSDHKEVAALLLERGANIETADKNGWTPLLYAAHSGHKEVASLLLRRGANIEAADSDGRTPLYTAAWNGYAEMVSLLLECGARVTTFVFGEVGHKPPGMTTPLHYIMSSGSDEKLAAVLHELKSGSLSDEDVLRSVDSSLVAVLLATDGRGRAVVDLLHARLSRTSSPGLASIAGILGHPAVTVLLERTPIPYARVLLCGPGGAGKTLLRCQLEGDTSGAHDLETKPILETRTRSMRISSATLRNVLPTQIYDFGGQQEYEVTNLQLLGQALSMYLLTIAVCPAGLKYRAADGGEHYIMEPTTTETTKRDLKHWLSLLSTLAHPVANQVVVAVNVFEGADSHRVERHIAAVEEVLKEYSAWAKTKTGGHGASPRPVDSGAREEGRRDGAQTRLNLVGRGFVVLNCKSSTEWGESDHENGSLFDSMRTAWANLQSLEESHGVELSMPKLCSDLLARVPEFRQTRPPIDAAEKARKAVRRTMGGVFENLSDKAVDALLGYVEKCGEVLLKYPRSETRDSEQMETTSQLEDVVIWEPNWFMSSVVGEFFQPLAWRQDVLLDVRMKPQDVRGVLRFPVKKAMPDVDDEEMERLLSTLMGLMKDMQLCAYVRTRTDAEYWFPLFLNSPDLRMCLSSDEAHGKRLPIERGVLQDHLPAKDILYAQFEDLAEHAWKVDDCRLRGRLLSIRELRSQRSPDDREADTSLDWRIVLPGSFERFMARVLEAFPDETEDHVQLLMTPSLIQLTWQSFSNATKCAHVQCQLVHESGIKVAWIAWVWASDDEAAAYLLKGDPAEKNFAQRDVTLQVIEQLCGWMQEASRNENVMVSWHEYPLQSKAFLRNGGNVFQEWRRYLAPCEREFPSSAEEVKTGETQAAFQVEKGGSGSTLKSPAHQVDPQSVLRFTKASFNLLKKVGEGAYGTVWRAVEVGTSGPEYAIKEMKMRDRSPTQQRKIRDAFEAEVRNLRAARHENVVPFIDFFTCGEASAPEIAIVTLFASLGSFDDVMGIAENMYLELYPDELIWEALQALLSPDVRRYMLLKSLKDVASGLEYLHSMDIIHRDLKPANVLLFPPFTAKLSDFGTSKQVLHGTSIKQTEGVGTGYYMAPEVRNGSYSFAADCWSFGIVLHEASHRLLTPLGSTGEDRHARVPPRTRALPESVRDLESIRDTCVQVSPESRYDTRGSGPKLSDALAAFDALSGDEGNVLKSLSELLQAYNRVDLCSGGGS